MDLFVSYACILLLVRCCVFDPCKHCRHKWECGYLLHQCRKKFRSVLGDTAPPATGAVRP